MVEVLPMFIEQKVSPEYKSPAPINLIMYGAEYYWFYSQMNHNAPWDIKNKESWQLQFSDIPFPDKEKFIFREREITSEDLGNICYGYFGTKYVY